MKIWSLIMTGSLLVAMSSDVLAAQSGVSSAAPASNSASGGSGGARNGERPEGGPGGHRGPPPEAIAACEKLRSGDTCRFESPRGAETGVCWAPAQKPLACKPDHPPGEQERPARGEGAQGSSRQR